jgi:hypothetical protein
MFEYLGKLFKSAVIITVILCAVGTASLGHVFWVDVGHTLSTLVGHHSLPSVNVKK